MGKRMKLAIGVSALIVASIFAYFAISGNGTVSRKAFDNIKIGDTQGHVEAVLGKPLQTIPGETPGEVCDVYEVDPGLQGGIYLHVCFVHGTVSRKYSPDPTSGSTSIPYQSYSP